MWRLYMRRDGPSYAVATSWRYRRALRYWKDHCQQRLYERQLVERAKTVSRIRMIKFAALGLTRFSSRSVVVRKATYRRCDVATVAGLSAPATPAAIFSRERDEERSQGVASTLASFVAQV
jgi:hypothetical protein